MIYVYLAIGGVAGTIGRYALGNWIHTWAGIAFPWGTLTVNVLGSFLLGLAVRGSEFYAISPEVRALLTVGFCGAFTTFSTLSYEFVAMAQAGAWSRASVYAIASLGIGIVALALGLVTGSLLLRPDG